MKRKSSVSILDVARYILKQQGKMGCWKLQKLCYYAQTWTLAWDRKELFSEDFEAWSNGAVCPSLLLACNGNYLIKPKMIHGKPRKLSKVQKENIDIVLEYYGNKFPYWLREQNVSEYPYKSTERRKVITKESMLFYYASLKEE